MKKILAMAAVAALCLALGMAVGVGRREGLTLIFDGAE